jgi:hypothetical protein
MRGPVVASCLAGVLLTAVACCGSSRGPEAFCQRLQTNKAVVITGVVDAKTAKAAVAGYEKLDGVAPEAIRTEWHQLTLLVQAAADLDPTATTARAALVQQAFSAAPAAQTVTDYARQTCGVDLTTPPATTTPAVTTGPTTVPPAAAPPDTTAPATPTPPSSG